MNGTRTRTAEKIARQLNAVRQRRIKALKNKIASGQYLVDNAVLARALFMAR